MSFKMSPVIGESDRRKAIAPIPTRECPPSLENVWRNHNHDRQLAKAQEERINQQFRYFRKEFIDAASTCSIPIPLDIIEDPSGRIFSFVKFGGPEYILQMLLSETESIHLMRTSLSLLIVTISILRRKVPISDYNGLFSSGLFSASFSDSMAEWAHNAIRHLTESGAISICINLLITTFVQDIQELIITLIAHFVASSKEAAFQMLQAPNSLGQLEMNLNQFKKSASIRGLSSSADDETPGRGHPHHHHKEPHNDWTDSGAGNDVGLAFAERFAQKSQHHLSKLNAKSTEPSTCLSYLLSVCALYHNRLAVMSNCAEVMMAMTSAFDDPFFAHQVSGAPTCYLPSAEDIRAAAGGGLSARQPRTRKQSRYAGGSTVARQGSQATVTWKGGLPSAASAASSSSSSSSSVRVSSYGIVEWAGLKLMLKCLHRIVMCDNRSRVTSAAPTLHPPSSAQEKNALQQPQHQASRSMTREEIEAENCHFNVLMAVMLMASKSQLVSSYLIELSGAEELLKTSINIIVNEHPTVHDKVVRLSREYLSAIAEAHNQKSMEALQASIPASQRKDATIRNAHSAALRRDTQINFQTPEFLGNGKLAPISRDDRIVERDDASEHSANSVLSSQDVSSTTTSINSAALLKLNSSSSPSKSKSKLLAIQLAKKKPQSSSSQRHSPDKATHSSTKTHELRMEHNMRLISSKSGEDGEDGSSVGAVSRQGSLGAISLTSISRNSTKGLSSPGKVASVASTAGSTLSEMIKLDSQRPPMPRLIRPPSRVVPTCHIQVNGQFIRDGPPSSASSVTSIGSGVADQSTASLSQASLSEASRLFDEIADGALKDLYKKGFAINGKIQPQLERAYVDYFYASDKLPGTANSKVDAKKKPRRIAKSSEQPRETMGKVEQIWEADVLAGQLESIADNRPEIAETVAPKYDLHILSTDTVAGIKRESEALSGIMVDVLSNAPADDDLSSIGSVTRNSAVKSIEREQQKQVSSRELWRGTHSSSVVPTGSTAYSATDSNNSRQRVSSSVKIKRTPSSNSSSVQGGDVLLAEASSPAIVNTSRSRFFKPQFSNETVAILSTMTGQSMEIQAL